MEKQTIAFIPTREALASILLIAGSLGGVALSEAAKVDPARAAIEDMRLPLVIISEEQSDDYLEDTNGQPYNPPKNGASKNKGYKADRTFPVRRTFGRESQIGGRFRGDIRTSNHRFKKV